jgi:D-sedoheptulose 7-phosphate isomerase
MASQFIHEHFANHLRTIEAVARQLSPGIERCAEAMVEAYRNGKKVLIMGNGGSAADAQHFAAELVGRFLLERQALPAIALTTDTSILTAVGNDYGFEAVFSRQVEALAQAGDVVLGLSTSGHSRNVYLALQAAKKIGCVTVGLLGRDGGAIADLVDLNLTVQSHETPRIQEAHVTIIHILCDLVEKALFPAAAADR